MQCSGSGLEMLVGVLAVQSEAIAVVADCCTLFPVPPRVVV